MIVDLAIDAPADRTPVPSTIGPTFHPEELAGRKLLALFDRAEARDFADVYELARRFDRALMLRRAAEADLGFDRAMLAEMMRTIVRFTDDELPVADGEADDVRMYFRSWADELDRSAHRAEGP